MNAFTEKHHYGVNFRLVNNGDILIMPKNDGISSARNVAVLFVLKSHYPLQLWWSGFCISRDWADPWIHLTVDQHDSGLKHRDGGKTRIQQNQNDEFYVTHSIYCNIRKCQYLSAVNQILVTNIQRMIFHRKHFIEQKWLICINYIMNVLTLCEMDHCFSRKAKINLRHIMINELMTVTISIMELNGCLGSG